MQLWLTKDLTSLNTGRFLSDNDEMIETRRIASLRIHIERAFSRVKSFKILNNIPNNMAGLSSEIFYTCALLTNFQPPLICPAKEINREL